MASKVNGIIEQIQIGSESPKAIASTAYGYCETLAATPGKTVDMTGFQLVDGVTVHIRFEEQNSASNPTLNINNTGDFPMVQYGTTSLGTINATSGWQAGAVISFTFVVVDSTHKYWVRDQAVNAGTVIKLNGTTKSGLNADIYAPISSGNSGELLISSGENNAPSWTNYGKFSTNTWIFNQKLKINPESNDNHLQNLYVNGTTYITDETQIGTIILNPSGTQQNTITTINTSRTDLILNPTGRLCLYQTNNTNGATPTVRVILDENTFYPATNQILLGTNEHYWEELYATTIITTPAGSDTKPIYIGSNGRITESGATVGNQYQPVYLSSGTITAAYPIQYLSWTFRDANAYQNENGNGNQIVFSNNLFTASTYVLSIVVTSGESNLNGPIAWETKVNNNVGQLILSTTPKVSGTVSGYLIIAFGTDLSSIQGT